MDPHPTPAPFETPEGRLPQTTAGFVRDLRRRLPLFLALAMAVVVGLGLYADVPSLFGALGRFNWVVLPIAIGLTLVNYLLRFAKWSYYLAIIDVRDIPWFDSLLIFFSGLAMVVTPGKLGEWLKSFLLKEARGVPVSVSAPIILAERLTDGLAMVLLAALGLFTVGFGLELLLFVLVGMAGFILVIQYRRLALALLGLGERVPMLARRMHHLHRFYESAYQLLRWRPLLFAVGLGVISWGAECAAFYAILVGLGVEGSVTVLLQATFILAGSTLVGAVSMIPGGLAVAEGSLAGMLVLLGVTSDAAVAAAATLLIRIGTLWFGVVVGIIALALVGRRMAALAGDRSPNPVATSGR